MATTTRLRTKNGLSNQIGPQVKERIRALKITNSLLCGRIADGTEGHWNPDPVEITHIIRGRRAVLTTELAALAAALECEAAYLLESP